MYSAGDLWYVVSWAMYVLASRSLRVTRMLRVYCSVLQECDLLGAPCILLRVTRMRSTWRRSLVTSRTARTSLVQAAVLFQIAKFSVNPDRNISLSQVGENALVCCLLGYCCRPALPLYKKAIGEKIGATPPEGAIFFNKIVRSSSRSLVCSSVDRGEEDRTILSVCESDRERSGRRSEPPLRIACVVFHTLSSRRSLLKKRSAR